VRHRDDVAPGVCGVEPIDFGPYALDEIAETLPTGRALIGRGKPQRLRADLAFGKKGLALEPLPIAQMLLGQGGERLGHDTVVPALACAQDRRGRLLGARQMARHPYRIAGQFARQEAEDLNVAAIAIEVALAIDAALVRHRSVPDPPPARRRDRHVHYSMVTTILPSAARAASRAIASPARAKG